MKKKKLKLTAKIVTELAKKYSIHLGGENRIQWFLQEVEQFEKENS